MPKLSSPTIIFARPESKGNLGALARVMSNFDCRDLRIVGSIPPENPNPQFNNLDWALACKGSPILESARVFASLPDALADIDVAFGTSGRDAEFEKGYARPIVEVRNAFKTLENWKAQGDSQPRWALVFGCESSGLESSESAHCMQLIRISTVDQSPSMNIAMAAGMLLYHWHLYNMNELADSEFPKNPGAFVQADSPRGEWADLNQKEQFLNYLFEILEKTQFFKYPDQEALRARLRRWLQSMPLPQGELLLGFEALYHLKSWGEKKFGPRDFFRKS